MTTSNKTRALQMTAEQTMIDGLLKHAATIGNVVIGGKTFVAADIVTLLQASLAASKKVGINHTALEASLQAETTVRAQNKPVIDGFTQTLQTMFAGQVDTLGDFGLTGPKKAVIPPATRVAAAKKAAATRKLRGTMGKKARLAITAAPAVEPAPAPAAAPATAPTTAPKA